MSLIEIRRLRLLTFIGVPDEERAEPQTLLATIRMTPRHGFELLDDDISRTIDYYAVSIELQKVADERPRRLIETLAVDIADHLFAHHALEHLSISIEKHILPNTECVAVHYERTRAVN